MLTDVHTPEDCLRLTKALGDVEAVLQIPAFLCRQTDLLIAAAHTGRAINIKKGQFVAPHDMQHAVLKVRDTAPARAIASRPASSSPSAEPASAITTWSSICVRCRSCATLRRSSSMGPTRCRRLRRKARVSGGQPEFIPVLARAAVAAGVDGVFLEVHDDPAHAKSDGANALRLDKLKGVLEQLLAVHKAVAKKL